MSTLSSKPVSIPRSRRAIAVLRDDGTGELTINGVTQALSAPSIDEARALVVERVSAHAHKDGGGPVRLLASDPAAWWELAVYPDDSAPGDPSSGGRPAADRDGEGIPNRTDHCPHESASTLSGCPGQRAGAIRRLPVGHAPIMMATGYPTPPTTVPTSPPPLLMGTCSRSCARTAADEVVIRPLVAKRR